MNWKERLERAAAHVHKDPEGDRFSASDADYIGLCSGRILAQRGLDDTGNKYSWGGTAKHEIMHEAVKAKELIIDEGMPDEAVTHVKWAWDWLMAMLSEGWIVLDTERHYVSQYCSGTIDLVLEHFEHGVMIVDWKFGNVIVPETTKQLDCYGYLAVTEYNSLTSAIVQPPAERYVTRDVSVENVEKTVRHLWEDWQRWEHKRTPHNEACANCSACGTGRCPESIETTALMKPGAEILPMDRLVELLSKVKVVENVCKTLKAQALTTLQSGTQEQKDELAEHGWAIKKGSTSVKINDVDRAYDSLSDRITAEEFKKALTITVAALEKAMDSGGILKKDLREYVLGKLGDNVEVSTNKPSLMMKTVRGKS